MITLFYSFNNFPINPFFLSIFLPYLLLRLNSTAIAESIPAIQCCSMMSLATCTYCLST